MSTFRVDPGDYDRYIGRYGPELSAHLLAAAGVRPGMTAVDIGCGPGALTSALAGVLGPDRVLAVEPSPSFAAACRARNPGVDVREAGAEELPFPDGIADAVLSQLVVNFVAEPVRAMAEMRRVAVPGGVVGAIVWDYAGRMTLLRAFWDAAVETDGTGRAAERDEGRSMRFCRPDELEGLWSAAGLEEVVVRPVQATAGWESFAELWACLEAGVGPSGAWAAGLDAPGRDALRDAFHRRLGRPAGAFEVPAGAWCVIGREPAADR